MTFSKIVNRFFNLIKNLEESLDRNKTILKITKSMQMNRFSCGIHSAFMILSYYNKTSNPNQIKYNMKLLKKEGIDTEPLLKILKNFGCTVSVNIKANISDIVKSVNERKPILISVDDGEHWVVIYGYSNSSIYVLDPSIFSSIKCRWEIKTFLSRWDENWIAVISKG